MKEYQDQEEELLVLDDAEDYNQQNKSMLDKYSDYDTNLSHMN